MCGGLGLQRTQAQHCRRTPVHGLHHQIQHPLQRRQALPRDAGRDGEDIRGRLHRSCPHPSRRGQGQREGAPAHRRLHPLDREGAEGHPAALDNQKARPQARQVQRPQVQGVDEARGVQSVSAQRLADDGPQPVHERRLPRRQRHLLLHRPSLQLAARHRHRVKALAGTFLPRHGLAVRGRADSHPRQKRGAHQQNTAIPLRPRLGHAAHTPASVRRGRTLPRGRLAPRLGGAENASDLPAGTGLRARRRQGQGLQGLRTRRLRLFGSLPHEVQCPHTPERGLHRPRYRERGPGPAPHDALRPQQGFPRPDLLRHRQPLPQPRRHRQGHQELRGRRRQVDPQRHREGHPQRAPRRSFLRRGPLRESPALLRRGRAHAA